MPYILHHAPVSCFGCESSIDHAPKVKWSITYIQTGWSHGVQISEGLLYFYSLSLCVTVVEVDLLLETGITIREGRTLNVCLLLIGNIDRSVSITISTLSASATGTEGIGPK